MSVPTVQESAGYLEVCYENKHKTQGSSPLLPVEGRACRRPKGKRSCSSRLHLGLTFCLLPWREPESSPGSGRAVPKTELPLGNWSAAGRLLKGKREEASPTAASVSHRAAYVHPCPTSLCSRHMSWAFVPLCFCSYYIPRPKGQTVLLCRMKSLWSFKAEEQKSPFLWHLSHLLHAELIVPTMMITWPSCCVNNAVLIRTRYSPYYW